MSDTDLKQSQPAETGETGSAGPGFFHLTETESATGAVDINALSAGAQPSFSAQATDRTGTNEHLAARRALPPLDMETPEIKLQLSVLRAEITRIVTDVRWEKVSVEEAAQRLVPLLNVGPVQQWQEKFIPFLLEIDRTGSLLPVWLHIIRHVEDPLVPLRSNPAETPEGRARRYAVLMLGNYKRPAAADGKEQKDWKHFFKAADNNKAVTAETITTTLGRLAIDPNTSLYAVPSLVKLETKEAMQELLTALKEAEGWAKVDIVEGILTIKQVRFYDLLLASGLDNVPGLESYIAIPLYRTLPLDIYLRAASTLSPRLIQQAALIFAHILQIGMTPPTEASQALPVVFERDLMALAHALFEGARNRPMWQSVVALHRLATFLGRYWSAITHGTLQDPRMSDPVRACLPMMPDVERWMTGQGRDTLLEALTNAEEEAALAPLAKILGELREPRASLPLLAYLESLRMLSGRVQALALEAICNTLTILGERRAVGPMQALVGRIIDVERRMSHPRRREHLPLTDGDVPGSIVYAAVIRACGQLGSRETTVDTLQRASRDFDPYIRTQALQALKLLDPRGEDVRSHTISRDLLSDPNDTIVRLACQLVAQYRDTEAAPLLQRLAETRPELVTAAYDALRQLG